MPRADLPFEFMMNALRLNEGFALDDVQRAHRHPGPAKSQPTLDAPGERAACWSATGQTRLAATDLGRRFLNDLIGRFLPAEKSQVAGRQLGDSLRRGNVLSTAPGRRDQIEALTRDMHDGLRMSALVTH